VKNRQNPSLKKKELFYGEKRPFTLDAPPEDPGGNFLSRVSGAACVFSFNAL